MEPELGPDHHGDIDCDPPGVLTLTEAQAPSLRPRAGRDCESKPESD